MTLVRSEKLHVAPYGIRPVPSEDHHACVYQVHNIDTGKLIGTPFPMDAKEDAFNLARCLNEEWKEEQSAHSDLLSIAQALDEYSDRTGGVTGELRQIVNQARAAIKKASGAHQGEI